jgi:transcriptional regulator with XRE-family HTH domain
MGATGELIGGRIKELRESAGMTQQQLAGKAGISLSNLSQIEQGKKDDPRISTLVAIADVLSVSLDVLAGRTRSEPPAGAAPLEKRRSKKTKSSEKGQ